MSNTKGMELPVNMLVILVIAIIVLAATIAVFTGVWTPGKESTENVGNFNAVCAQYAASGCCGETDAVPEACSDTSGTALRGRLNRAAEPLGGDGHALCCRT